MKRKKREELKLKIRLRPKVEEEEWWKRRSKSWEVAGQKLTEAKQGPNKECGTTVANTFLAFLMSFS